MQVQPSIFAALNLIGPDAAEFNKAVEALLGREPDDVVSRALPYSVIAKNDHSRAVALLGIRFDMAGPMAKRYSVIHYADTLSAIRRSRAGRRGKGHSGDVNRRRRVPR